jgi:hypothetical protein
MDMHNFPTRYAGAIAASEDRMRGLRRERMVRRDESMAQRPERFTQRILCEPLVAVVAMFPLGWLLFQRG